MKFFIFMCCTAHLLTGITSRFRRTTPMPNGDEARQIAKFADMIDFVNNVHNNGRRSARIGRYDRSLSKHHISRRLDSPRDIMNHFLNLAHVREEDVGAQLNKLSENVRFQVIDNPEVIEEFKNKQMNKNSKKLPEYISPAAKLSSTGKNKLEYFQSKTIPEVIQNEDPATDITTQDDVQELTTDEFIYTPSISDDDNDDEPITAGIEPTNSEIEKNEPRADNKDHSVLLKINKTDELEKRTHDNRASDMDYKAQINRVKYKLGHSYDKKKIQDSKIDNEEYSFTKLIQSQETLNEDIERLKDKYGDEKNKEHGYSGEKSEKDTNQKAGSWGKNTRNFTSAEKTIYKMDNNMNNDHDWVEEHSIYSQTDRNENDNKHSKKSQEKRDKNDKQKKGINNDRMGKQESQWIKISSQTDNTGILRNKKDEDWDKTEDKRSKEEKDRDNNGDGWNKNERDFDKNDERWSKTEKDSDNNNDKWGKKGTDLDKNDDRWSKKERNLDKNYVRGSKKEKDLDENNDRWSKKEKDLDENNDRWSKKEKDLDENNDRWSKKEKDLDENNDRWSKKDKDLDENNDRWSKKDKDWDNNGDKWDKKHKNRDKNDDRWSIKEKYWDKTDNEWTKKERDLDKNDDSLSKKEKYQDDKQRSNKEKFDAEYEWNKRHAEYDNFGNDDFEKNNQRDIIDKEWTQKDKDWNDRDDEYKKRDKDWTKKDDGRNKNPGRTHIEERQESENKHSKQRYKKERAYRHDRYKIVDRIDNPENDGNDRSVHK